MIPPLPNAFLQVPIAHRALHDISDNRPENSRAAIQAAIDAGYGIEIDLQLTSDDRAMVFHDYDMARLTGQPGPIRQVSAAAASGATLLYGDDGIPTLDDVLEMVAGRVPLLIELKDQDGAMGANVGALERDTVRALLGYDGPVALMSFNPNSVAELARLAPHLPRGITTCAYEPSVELLPQDICDNLRGIPDFYRVGASFISHEAADLSRPRVAELKARGVPILCWTVRSPEQEAEARKVADNVTFEGYLAAHSA
ncbi:MULTISPECIES: glycerophosphodiester phosphodiesterase family protein [unclassified Ruegeria]|uniref:glycerophosphodiester phosphodiesterase family protein n=1 Tax=unclassified Ruegeria TaxID=2625375 RepID=UPI001492F026|nr:MULTISPECIES: glycerophosphodiester phosphodiesterase family protein [unclassified Ruegeria]NOD48796.1 phosphodiesterase [Ruegeria sp. HKCCD5849]NOD51901.1 phosphodiesterase [Ruegeria sp. HKCCD5851]NOD66559.1 phosphodiesterase [Ruegeria sp. HKCCD7303]